MGELLKDAVSDTGEPSREQVANVVQFLAAIAGLATALGWSDEAKTLIAWAVENPIIPLSVIAGWTAFRNWLARRNRRANMIDAAVTAVAVDQLSDDVR